MAPQYWQTVEKPENYEPSPETYGFARNTDLQRASSMQPGDLIVDYVKGRGWSCIMRVGVWENGMIVDYRPDLDSKFPWRIRIESSWSVGDAGIPNWREISPFLSFVGAEGGSPQVLRQNLREISEADFQIIAEAMGYPL